MVKSKLNLQVKAAEGVVMQVSKLQKALLFGIYSENTIFQIYVVFVNI